MHSPVLDVLRALAPVLDDLGIPWCVFGAQAAVVHGRPRLSDDVDITVQIDKKQWPVFLFSLKEAGFDLQIHEEHPYDFIAQTQVIPLCHRTTRIPIDIVLAGSGLEAMFLEQAEPHDFGGVIAPVIRPEHLIVTKLLAGRNKDREDVLGILLRQKDSLDMYMVRQLLEQMEEALSQSDLIPLLDDLISKSQPS